MDFIPYGRQTIEQDDIDSVIKTLQSDFLTTGPKVAEFEKAICDYTGAKYTIAVSNGTAALHLASLVLLNKNDKVLTTPNSFLATSNSILYAGAKPVFVDIANDGLIDLDLCEEYLKKDDSIKAIYGVSFSGKMLNQKKLRYLKKTYNIKILEDNAHSIGAKYQWKMENGKWKIIKAGSCSNSDMSIFSFHPVKHITAGEGGAITTNSKEFYEQLLTLRNHGIVKTSDMKPWEYEMRELGFNYRITDIQCSLGLSQLKKLDSFIQKRVSIAKRYDKAFKNSIIKPLYYHDGTSSYHLYVARVDFTKLDITKEKLFVKMKEKNIGLQLHYMPINKQPYYRSLGYGDEDTPNMHRYYQECFSLPMYPLLSDKEQEYVIKTLFEVLK
jgi:UDP-4-amino-4,6-dideoxy-N-acetyl-beta-L-altrosamine transaminase